MSDTKTSASSIRIKNEILNEKFEEINSNNRHQLLSSDFVGCNVNADDTLSVCTSCSDLSNTVCSLESSEFNVRPNFIKNIEPPNASFGSVCVENSTDVTFGNKVYFQGPVVITNLVVDGSNVEGSEEIDNKLNPLKKS